MMIMERDDTPPDFVAFRESLVNVLCHQDYQDHTRNPNIAIAFRRIGFSENAGWGLNDVIANWTKLGHARPIINNGKLGKNFEVTLMTDEVTPEVEVQVTGEVFRLLDILARSPLTRAEIQSALELKGQASFRDRYLEPALKMAFIEMTIPDKPKSSRQKYRLTEAGHSMQAQRTKIKDR